MLLLLPFDLPARVNAPAVFVNPHVCIYLANASIKFMAICI